MLKCGQPKTNKINSKTQNRVGCPSFRHQIKNGTCLDIITESAEKEFIQSLRRNICPL